MCKYSVRLGGSLRAIKTQIIDEQRVPNITLAHHHPNQEEEWMLEGRWLPYQPSDFMDHLR